MQAAKQTHARVCVCVRACVCVCVCVCVCKGQEKKHGHSHRCGHLRFRGGAGSWAAGEHAGEGEVDAGLCSNAGPSLAG